ncbi:PhoX family protein [Lusitaniella coriacea]|uniref:PhoX family protein n=1 Tax=Lusitaniella coriacea TaxID=1983105 RepID=UPI003CF52BCF
MSINRRDFLLFLGTSLGTASLGLFSSQEKQSFLPFAKPTSAANTLPFQAIKTSIPLEIEGLSPLQQIEKYNTYEVIDDLVLPEGFTYDVILAWGDRVGDSRCGYNNDYLSFVETQPSEGYLTSNFEYIRGKTWMQSYSIVMGRSLPFEAVKAAVSESDGAIDAFSLPNGDPLKAQIEAIAKEALTDLGIGVISLRFKDGEQWERTHSTEDRRITGISGLEDGRYLKTTGPGVAVFKKANKLGYEDGLGDRAIGTFQNCAGGTTPWGTVFSAEENCHVQVPEPVMADGSSLSPSQRPFLLSDKYLAGCGNVFGLAGNKYGWIVEVDPANPKDYGTKHTWLGRYRHEAVGIRAIAGKRLALYSGCDRRGGHLYKFVSTRRVRDPKNKANSRLLEEGMLYGAKFNADGTGNWVPLTLDTPVDPVLPSQVAGGMVTLPNSNRQEGGIVAITRDEEMAAFQQQFETLGDLYEGNEEEKQGAILIDAHFAANAAGITCTARPEDTMVAPDGTLFIAFTSGNPGGDGGPDKDVFRGPNGELSYEYGWIMRLEEKEGDPAARDFRWSILAMGGEPADGGMGFSNPDNLELDNNGNLWMVTDMSTSYHNRAIASRTKEGKSLSTKDLLGLFGNNSLWFIPTQGENAGTAYPFATAPMDSELTGPFWTRDRKTLFLAIQHPGENGGMRQNNATETRHFALRTTNGKEFMQKRKVPLGSNWPNQQPNTPPRPAIVAIRQRN